MAECRTGMRNVGPMTAITLMELWASGHIDMTLIELRHLVKVVANFLEEVEELRAAGLEPKRRS